MAIKSEADRNYYLYDKAKVCLRVDKSWEGLSWRESFHMVENNGHPYVHDRIKKFAKICQGRAAGKMPTSGKDVGEVIAKRLRKMKEVLMYGYTWEFFDPVSEGRYYDKDYPEHKRSLSELKKMDIPIIVKGELLR